MSRLRVTAALALAMASPCERGAADEPPPRTAPDLRATTIFQYGAPQAPHPWRAGAEIAAGLAFQMAVYAKNPSASAVEGGPTYHSPWDKLVHGDWTFDANEARTNFGAHPLGGALFYLVARGNRVGVVGSSLAAIVGSTVWELGEVRETASINDTIVTPLAGIAIGEPMAQLSAFFEQRDAGGGDRVLAWIFQPLKKGHDLLDGARVARRPQALAHGELRLRVDGGALQVAGSRRADLGLSLSGELVRDRGYGEAGRDARWLADGNWVRMEAGLGGGPDGLARGRFRSEAMLVTFHARDLEGEDTPAGQDVLAGVGLGFEFESGRFEATGPLDWRSLVHAPGLVARWRLLGGAIPLDVRARAAPTFGGVRSLVLAGGAEVPPEDLPTVTRAYGYTFALGGTAEVDVEARPGPLRLEAGLRLDGLRGFTQKDPQPLPGGTAPPVRDRRGEAYARAGWVLGGWALGVEAERRWGEGEIGPDERTAGATRVSAVLEARR